MSARAIDASAAALRSGEKLLWSGSPNPTAWAFVRLWPFSLVFPCVLVLLITEADFSRGLPLHGGNLLVAVILTLAAGGIQRRVSRGARLSEFLVTDQRVIVVRPVVVVPPWVRRPKAVECPLAELSVANASALPFSLGYGNVYFGRPSSWWRAPAHLHLGYMPVEALEFFAIRGSAAVAGLVNENRVRMIAEKDQEHRDR